jgi:FkbM family methyltransferase
MEAINRRVRLYRLRKSAGVPLRSLIAYDTTMRLNKQKRIALGNKILNKSARDIALKNYGLKFTEGSNVNEIFNDKIYTLHDDFIPSKKDIIVDVGAQYGDYAILCSKYYHAKTYTFEPLPDNFKVIKQNAKMNDIKDNSLKMYNVALSNKNYEGYIYYSGDMANKELGGKKIKTKFRTLDSFKLKPTILKIDVEGFELDVIEGAINTIKKYKPKIIIETHSRELERQTKEKLNTLGYGLKHTGRVVYNANSNFDKVTNLFFIPSKN